MGRVKFLKFAITNQRYNTRMTMQNTSEFSQWMQKGPLGRVRRNHALEHATLQVLAEQNTQTRAAGYSDAHGFWLVGQLETTAVERAVQMALIRMQAGEHALAIHPNCGTNIVTAGFMAGTAAWLAMLGGNSRSWRDRLDRWPLVISLVTFALILAQPIGPQLQARFTTSSAVQDLRIVRIERNQRGEMPLHRILTEG